MRKFLHLDLETFSPVDLIKCGTYRYAEEAEIMLCAWAFDDEPVQIVDLTQGEEIPPDVVAWLMTNETYAQNANFERVLLSHHILGKGTTEFLAPENWKCTSVWAAATGLPASLGPLSEVLKLGDEAKQAIGKKLIRKFCIPRKPTKNDDRTRVLSTDEPGDWELFKGYCMKDVEAERAVHRKLSGFPMPDREWDLYHLDQRINDRGVGVNTKLVLNAIKVAEDTRLKLFDRAQELTQLDNPNSRDQIIAWLDSEDVITSSLTKAAVIEMLGGTTNPRVKELLEIRLMMSKASVTKYQALARAVCADGRLRGTLKFNGAGRTCRWAGQIFQPQNLPSKLALSGKEIAAARDHLLDVPEMMDLIYPSVPDALSALVRPALVPHEGRTFVVADYSAIEARILAWLANETWRLELFEAGLPLYETSAEKMFKLPPGSVGKKDPMRQRGKVSELALGYQGWTGALITMGALDMGLTEEELPGLASAWREANPNIEKFWGDCEKAAVNAVRTKAPHKVRHVTFNCDGSFLFVVLPSGRRLNYAMPRTGENDRGKLAVSVMGIDGKTKRWTRSWLYGGLIVENICQAVARDCLRECLLGIAEKFDDYHTELHVHDEVIVSVPASDAQKALSDIEHFMAVPIEWAPTLLLKGDGFTTSYYRKED